LVEYTNVDVRKIRDIPGRLLRKTQESTPGAEEGQRRKRGSTSLIQTERETRASVKKEVKHKRRR